MKKSILYCTIIISTLFSCKKEDKVQKEAIARVFDSYLYKQDVIKQLPQDITGNDSLLLAKNLINRWVKEQLLFKKAELNLSEDISEINELVKKYRNDLLVNKYKEAAVEQYLDTIVTENDIESFYNENKEIFKLNERLVRLKFIHFSNDVINANELKKLFKSKKTEDLDSLKSKEMQLKSLSLDDNVWIRFDDIKRKMPALNDSDLKAILKNSKFFEKKDSLGVYLIAVNGVLRRNQTAPMSYVTPTIKQMILHKRKLELIKKIEETLVEDAINNKEFEIYEAK